MKYIDTLDQNQVKSLFDYKDGHLYWKKNGKKAGYLRPTGYHSVEVNGKGLMLHRLIWIYHFGKPNAFIDHIDGNKSNNKIENLRLATKNQNSYNKKIHPNNKLGIKGLRLRKDNNKYEARICVDGKRLVLGGFDDLELAELVIFEARDKYHGVYANHG